MNVIRKCVERLCRGWVLKRTILVKGKSTALFVSPDAQLKYLKPGSGSFDSDLIATAEKFMERDTVVWDVGANIGVFTFASAAITSEGTVVAIEADIWLAGILRRTARLRSYSRNDIRIIPLAISNENSVASFQIAKRGRASNALESAGGRSQMGGARESQFVPTLALDTLLTTMPKPDFVKIDIEGAELMALQGAVRLINEIRPVFYIEVGEEVSSEILQIFLDANYPVYTASGKLLRERCDANSFFIPSEDRENIGRLAS